MYVYAGIDEAGYGPMFGPLVIGRAVMALPGLDADSPPPEPPDLWHVLRRVVCKQRSQRGGRIAVNDSKKLYTSGGGGAGRNLRHLELGTLAFAGVAGRGVATLAEWLDALGESAHHDLSALPWYEVAADRPWTALPCVCTAGEVSVARAMLSAEAARVGVQVLDLGAAVVFEDRFNVMCAATRSKAATSFTFVAGHLRAIWERWGEHRPCVVVDRQSGRSHYRDLLAMNFPEARMKVLGESETDSSYELVEATAVGSQESGVRGQESATRNQRSMRVSFLVDSEVAHLPVALASMVSKYSRELLMRRFNDWFSRRVPAVKPTAGYATDAQRFWREIEPLLAGLGIAPDDLRRMS